MNGIVRVGLAHIAPIAAVLTHVPVRCDRASGLRPAGNRHIRLRWRFFEFIGDGRSTAMFMILSLLHTG